MSAEESDIVASLTKRVDDLEKQLDIVCAQLNHAQRAIYCMGLVPPFSGRLPRPQLAKGATVPMAIPAGFNIVMGAGESVGNAIITSINKNGNGRVH